MTRRDIILKWIAYLVALAVITVVNFHLLGRLPIALPLLLPMAAVATGVLEGPRFGAAFGMVCGLAMAATGHSSLFCIPVLALIAWLCGLLDRPEPVRPAQLLPDFSWDRVKREDVPVPET